MKNSENTLLGTCLGITNESFSEGSVIAKFIINYITKQTLKRESIIDAIKIASNDSTTKLYKLKVKKVTIIDLLPENESYDNTTINYLITSVRTLKPTSKELSNPTTIQTTSTKIETSDSTEIKSTKTDKVPHDLTSAKKILATEVPSDTTSVNSNKFTITIEDKPSILTTKKSSFSHKHSSNEKIIQTTLTSKDLSDTTTFESTIDSSTTYKINDQTTKLTTLAPYDITIQSTKKLIQNLPEGLTYNFTFFF